MIPVSEGEMVERLAAGDAALERGAAWVEE
jgi:hypothetical protein